MPKSLIYSHDQAWRGCTVLQCLSSGVHFQDCAALASCRLAKWPPKSPKVSQSLQCHATVSKAGWWLGTCYLVADSSVMLHDVAPARADLYPIRQSSQSASCHHLKKKKKRMGLEQEPIFSWPFQTRFTNNCKPQQNPPSPLTATSNRALAFLLKPQSSRLPSPIFSPSIIFIKSSLPIEITAIALPFSPCTHSQKRIILNFEPATALVPVSRPVFSNASHHAQPHNTHTHARPQTHSLPSLARRHPHLPPAHDQTAHDIRLS